MPWRPLTLFTVPTASYICSAYDSYNLDTISLDALWIEVRMQLSLWCPIYADAHFQSIPYGLLPVAAVVIV